VRLSLMIIKSMSLAAWSVAFATEPYTNAARMADDSGLRPSRSGSARPTVFRTNWRTSRRRSSESYGSSRKQAEVVASAGGTIAARAPRSQTRREMREIPPSLAETLGAPEGDALRTRCRRRPSPGTVHACVTHNLAPSCCVHET
jgi:hypothetical protein